MIRPINAVPHSKPWNKWRTNEMQRRKKIRDCDGNERLAPGKLPDPDLERCLNRWSSVITDHEHGALIRAKPHHLTKSQFIRGIICQWLEARRRKDCPTKSFTAWMGNAGPGGSLGGPEGREAAPVPPQGVPYPCISSNIVPDLLNTPTRTP